MKSISVSLKYNQSANIFSVFTITQKGVAFIDYESVPPFDSEGSRVQVKQKHVIKISLELEGFGLLLREILNIDSDKKNSTCVVWQGYKITFNGLNGYTDTEVNFLIEKLPKEFHESDKRSNSDTVTQFNKRDIIAILTYRQSVTIFDTFSIMLIGIRNDVFTVSPNKPGVNRERIQFNLNGFGVSSDVFITITDEPVRHLIWHGFKISYLSHNSNDVRLNIEEIPDEEMM